MDVKSVFLNEILNEEVYAEQLNGFIDLHRLEHVFKLKKNYMGENKLIELGMKGLPYSYLRKGYRKWGTDKILFIRHLRIDRIVALIYVNSIVFGSTFETKFKVFVNLMQSEFEMNIIGKLNYFLGLQINR